MPEPTDTTIIGTDAHIKGELLFERAAKLNGKLDGKITGKGELHVSDGALCKADVNAGSVIIDGTVEGNLRARDTVRLNAKGVVRGDIVAAKMIMTDGATFFGQCAIGPDAAKQQPGKPAEQAPASADTGANTKIRIVTPTPAHA